MMRKPEETGSQGHSSGEVSPCFPAYAGRIHCRCGRRRLALVAFTIQSDDAQGTTCRGSERNVTADDRTNGQC